ncbi:MAG: cytochrome b/b6 domain-containing protein [Deltaproteobacteria bacterium]|nr:cytochrome b/b6 domain-containing protein [Deltaproteobacteria bacterium]
MRVDRRTSLGLFVLLSLALSSGSLRAESQPKPPAAAEKKNAEQVDRSDKACLECHADLAQVEKPRYVVKPGEHQRGPHADDDEISCIACHVKAQTVADPTEHGKLGPASCAGCHDDISAAYMRGMHHQEGLRSARTRLGKTRQLPSCLTCHGKRHTVFKVDDPLSPVHPRRQAKTCANCHGGRKHDDFMSSIHGDLLDKWTEEVGKQNKALGKPQRPPSCTTCHAGHDVERADVVHNPSFKKVMIKRCGSCHKRALEAYLPSIHGQALLERDVYDSASCVDCHASHEIRRHSDPRSKVFATKVVDDCGGCHANARLIKRSRLRSDVVETYEKSFHGRASQWGDRQVANCSSCHQHHAVFAKSDPRASTHPHNLKKTCGECHPGASANFVRSEIHVAVSESEHYWSWLVKQLYTWLIIFVIGGMIVHNFLDFRRKIKDRIAAHLDEPSVERMTRSERTAHILMASTFIVLAYTGFAILYPYAWWTKPLHLLFAGDTWRSTVHHYAGALLTLLAFQHLWFLFFSPRGREQRRHFMPRLSDFSEARHNIAYYLGRRAQRPDFNRFTYMEKLEYWALVWGTGVMVATGFVLWFKAWALTWMPVWLFDVCRVVHRYEAILAVLSIIVWHFYFVFVNPDEAPMATHWIHGRITKKELAKVHPRELRELDNNRTDGQNED